MSSSLITFGVLCAFCVLCITLLMQRRYGYMHIPWIVHIVLFISWYLSFTATTYLLSIDMMAYAHDTMFVMWNFIYWTSFVMTWLVIPLVYSYYQAGEFTFRGRMWASVRANLVFYGVVGLLILCFVIYIAVKKSLGFKAMLGFLVCLSQVWGLLLLTLLMGYGLVEVPRQLWRSGDYDVALKALHYKASSDFQDLDEAKDEVADAVKILTEVSQRMKPSSPLRRFVDVIETSIPSSATLGFDPHNRRISSYMEGSLAQEIRELKDDLDEDIMAKLNYYVKNSLRMLFLAQNQWYGTVDAADRLETLLSRKRNEESAPMWSSSAWVALKWRYNVHVKDHLYQCLGVLSGILSVLLIWGQLTMMSPVNISPLALLINGVHDNTAMLQVCGLAIASYSTLCACVGMWQLRLFSYYYMRQSHTDTSSLLLNASYLQRLIGPLGYTFYGVLRWKGSAFQEVLGRMDIVPFFGSYFNVYFPIMIAVLAVATATNVYGRFLKLLGISYFDAHSDYSGDLIAEGRMLIRKSKRMRNRPRPYRDDTRNGGDTPLADQDHIQLLTTPVSLDSALELDDI